MRRRRNPYRFGWTPYAWQSSERIAILIVTGAKKFEGSQIAAPMLDPALFHLALLANAEATADGLSGQQWIGQREVALHVAHAGGIQTWTYPPNSITPAEATRYLAALASDFLEPTQFDLLPFDIIAASKELAIGVPRR